MRWTLHTPEDVEITETDGANGVSVGRLLKHDVDVHRYAKNGSIVFGAESIIGGLRYMQREMAQPRQYGSSSEPGSEGEFYTYSTYDEAMDVFMNRPWELEMYQAAAAEVKAQSATGLELFYDVVGDELDIVRHLDGDPESWSYLGMGNPRNVVADIFLSIGYVWYIDKRSIARKLSRMLRLVDMLESNNVRTRLIAVESCQVSQIEFVVKQYEDPLYLPHVAIAAHGDFLRRICFRIAEYSSTLEPGYGRATTFTAGDVVIKPQPGVITMLIDQPKEIKHVDERFDTVEAEVIEYLENVDRGLLYGEWPVFSVPGWNS